MRKNLKAGAVTKAMNMLSRMYSLDIRNKELVLSINKVPLKYELPDFWLEPKSLKPYKRDFSIEFVFDKQIYSAYGWVGIRRKGSLDNEGFSIIRKGRALRTGYKPKNIFGGPNSYSQQRLIGEIHLDRWDVTHIKNDIQWEGGLEDKLLEEIKKEISDLIKLSETLRVSKDYESPEAKAKMAKNTQSSFKVLKEVDINETNINNNFKIEPKIIENDIEISDIIVENPIVEVPFKNKTYKFEIEYKNNFTKDWITIEKTNEDDTYRIILNIELDYFKMYNEDRKKVEFLQKIAVTISTALLLSKENGNQDYYTVLNALNTIVRNVK